MRRPEDGVQAAIVDGLSRLLPEDWDVVHVANKPRSAVAGAREKRLGARKGFPDLMIIPPVGKHRVAFIEVKAEGAYARPEQRACHERLSAKGYPVAVCRSFEDAVELAQSLGWPLRLARAVA